jgi:hypothetical protein
MLSIWKRPELMLDHGRPLKWRNIAIAHALTTARAYVRTSHTNPGALRGACLL